MDRLVWALATSIEKHPRYWLSGVLLFCYGLLPAPVIFGCIYCLVGCLIIPMVKSMEGLSPGEQAKYAVLYFKGVRGQRSALLCSTLIVLLFFRELLPVYFRIGPTNYLDHFDLIWLLIAPAFYSISFFSYLASLKLSLPKAIESSGRQKDFGQAQVNAGIVIFMLAAVLALAAISFAPHGPVTWLGNWLLASANDAALPGMQTFFQRSVPFFVHHQFSGFVSPAFQWMCGFRAATLCLLTIFFWGRSYGTAIFLTDLARRCARVPKAPDAKNFALAFAEQLTDKMRERPEVLVMREGNAWFGNVGKTILWLVACYCLLFFIFGLSTGPLGNAILSMTFDDCRRAGFKVASLTSDDLQRLRLFFAAVYALYGTVPLAVTGCVFFPLARLRRIVLTEAGIVCPRGFMTGLGGMPLRLWSDLASIDLVPDKKICIKFYSAGKLTLPLSRLGDGELDRLIGAVDEYAERCLVSLEVAHLRTKLQPTMHLPLDCAAEDKYKSTIFVPCVPGDLIDRGSSEKSENGQAITLRVVRLLATKPLCAVYLARLQNDGLVVVKQFYFGQDNAPAMQKAFAREHALLRSIDNEGIARVIDVFDRECSSFLVLQHWNGRDLRELVGAQGPLSELVVLEYARQLCALIRYLHELPQPIIHRDISPENIVVDQNGKIKLIDFGAAREFIAGVTGTLVGKQCYMAPEQIRGEADMRCDIYGFGCTLYYLLTGCDPRALVPSSPATLVNVSPWLDGLVASCTAFEADQRPQSFAGLSALLTTLPRVESSEIETLLGGLRRAAAPELELKI